jgi:hypothetical protein
MLTFNEGKVCEAIVQRLEQRLKAPRIDMRWPEDEQHPHAVEIAFTVAGELFALEHTGIEPLSARHTRGASCGGRGERCVHRVPSTV